MVSEFDASNLQVPCYSNVETNMGELPEWTWTLPELGDERSRPPPEVGEAPGEEPQHAQGVGETSEARSDE